MIGMCEYMLNRRIENIYKLKELMSAKRIEVRWMGKDCRMNRMLIHDEDPYDKLERRINEEAARQLNITRDAVRMMSGDGTKY